MMKNKKVFIIGGSSGIGLALAKTLLANGTEVIIASRTAAEKKKHFKLA